MGRGKTVTPEIRNLIIDGLKKEKTSSQIGRELKVPASSVRTVISNFKRNGNVKINFKGSKTTITPRDRRQLKKIVTANRRQTSSGINVEWAEVIQKKYSTETCKNTFKKLGYGFYKVRFFQNLYTTKSLNYVFLSL